MNVVIQFPDAAKPISSTMRSVVIATAEQTIAFHDEVARYHADQATKLRDQLNRFKDGKAQ